MSRTKGLKFQKFDLHIHTGASKCYSSDRTTCATDIVNAALNAGLSAIAITDHNTASGIDAVMTAAKGTGLRVFPGVEITVGDAHMHIVALFSPDIGEQHINELLTVLKLKNGGTQEAFCSCNVEDAINTITSDRFRGLAVLAHSDSSNGVLSSMKNAARIGVVQNWRLLAVEAKDVYKIRGFLDGRDPKYLRKLAVYQASDNLSPDNSGTHCAAAVGSRYSYFKVDDDISLESLRLCFVDPDVRIRQPDEYNPGESPRIVSVSVESGMFDEERIEFHSGLNCILGAKGAGKSMLIELLRFALNQPPTIESILNDHEEKLEEKLGIFGRVNVEFVDETGKLYSITRTFGTDEEDSFESTEYVRPAKVLPVMFLSQNEIVKIAESEEEQLKFIDRFFDVASYDETIKEIESKLAEWDRELARCVAAQRKVSELSEEIRQASKDEELLSNQLSSEVFTKYRDAEAKRAEMERHYNHVGNFVDTLKQECKTWNEKVTLDLPDTLQTDPALQRIQKNVSDLLVAITEARSELVKLATSSQAQIANEFIAWKPKYEQAKTEYEAHVRKCGGDDKALEIIRQQIAVKIRKLRTELDKHEPMARRLKQVSNDRKAQLVSLLEEYKNRHEERVTRCNRFVSNSGNRLRIIVHESTNSEAFKQVLLKMKKGSYVSNKDIASLCEKLKPMDIIWGIFGYAVGFTDALQKMAQQCGLALDKLTNLADYLLQQYEMEHILGFQYRAMPEDRPEIRLVQPNGTEVLLKQASVGQKCTAMLLMALCDESMPVIIDQPEDSLDNRTVWDDVCMKLRLHKDKRQFILATHNSSLAVASDTDKYIILEETSPDHATVALSGAVDNPNVKAEVVKYLEGGQETYLHKYAKYALQRS